VDPKQRSTITLHSETEQDRYPSGAEAAPEHVDPAVESDRQQILKYFHPLFSGTGGIDSWLHDGVPQTVIERLGRIDDEPLSRGQLNQLLVLAHEAGVSAGFFSYYWLEAPEHPYDLTCLDGFDPAYLDRDVIRSLAHLRWGLTRFFFDALLYFGNVRSAYRRLRGMDLAALKTFFNDYSYDSARLKRRGPALPLRKIPRDDRHLISEVANRLLTSGEENLKALLTAAYGDRIRRGDSAEVSIRELLSDSEPVRRNQMSFLVKDLLDEELSSISELEARVQAIVQRYGQARKAALQNTKLFLSMVDELDVYVATSMRTREDFREVSGFCDEIFADQRLEDLNVRYFDPTLSAAQGHEDKGLIECLMVKSAKVLIYFAGSQESYGKDAEAAMALGQGKPVILYCPDSEKRRFYRDVHPLARLIDFRNGVANGWMVVSSPADVSELLARILENRMRYQLEQVRHGYLRLKEELSGSVVRLQTSDVFLRETFWDYYNQHSGLPGAGVAG
jgi:hypothetical protein